MTELTKEQARTMEASEPEVSEPKVPPLPQAFEGRQVLVPITTEPGVDILVERWSWTKVKAMVKLVLEAFRGKAADEIEGSLEGETVDIASNMLDLLGDRAFTVIRESVRPGDKKYITPEMDANDVIDLFDATISVNEAFIDSLKKKGPAILRRFGLGSLLAKAKAILATSTSPSRPPSESSPQQE